MNNTLHTPGPFPLRITKNDDHFVIVTNHETHYAKTFDPSAAHLISAAPDLLSALQWFADELPEVIRQYCPEGVPIRVAHAYDAAWVAIAKAKGEA
jgi:hypothetical protein